MIENKIKLLSITTLIMSLLGLFCVEVDHTNPKSSEFVGDYNYTIALNDSLNDTMEIFAVYKLDFSSTGLDSFASIAVFDSAGINICDTINFNYNDNDTSVSIYFTKPYSGYLNFAAIRPNGKADITPFNGIIDIINPYKSNINSKVGVKSINRVEAHKLFNGNTIPDGIKILWEIGDTNYVISLRDSNYTSFTTKDNDLDYKAYVVDTFNQKYLIDSKKIQVEGNSPIIDSIIYPDSINLGDTLSFILKVTDVEIDTFNITIYTPIDTLTPDSIIWFPSDSSMHKVRMAKEIRDTGNVTISFIAKDKSAGLSSDVKLIKTKVFYQLPNPKFLDSVLTVDIGDSVTISFVDANQDDSTKYHWLIPQLGIDTETVTQKMKLLFENTDSVNVSVWGINEFGYVGDTAKLTILPMEFEYSVTLIDPETILSSNKIYTFTAMVTNSLGDALSDSVTYIWSLSDSVLTDTTFNDSNTFSIKIKNETGPFIISVKAIIAGSDSTPVYTHPVQIDKKPIVTFADSSQMVLLGHDAEFKINVMDDGIIDSVFILVNDSVYLLSKDSLDLYFYSFMPDSQITDTVYAWAIDDEGNVSDTVMSIFESFSNAPNFDILFDSATIFIHENYVIKLPSAKSGNNISGIKEYLWDLDGDGIFDKSTTEDTLSVNKTTAFDDIITVAAVNHFKDTSVTHFKFHLVVLTGIPLITKFAIQNPSTNKAFINEIILFSLVATDYHNGGSIKSVHIDYTGDSVADSSFSFSPLLEIEKVFSLSFKEGGEYKISVWVDDIHDNSSLVNTLIDTIFIDQGKPTIDSLSAPETIYINDSSTYTIHTTDPNGSVDFYYWSYDSINYDSLGNNNSFIHAFSDSGLKCIYIKIKDDDNNIIFGKDSIYVDLGIPFADSILENSIIWVNDPMTYSFYYHDINDTIDSISINWGDNSAIESFSVLGYDSFDATHTYPVTGDTSYSITLTVIDNDEITGSTSKTISVKEGKPFADSIVGDTSIWVNDTMLYSFYFHDVNDSIDSVFINWGDGSAMELHGVSVTDSNRITSSHAYPITEDTIYIIAFDVKDNDGVENTFEMNVNVKNGAPIIDSVTFNVKSDSIYVNDTVIYRIRAHDINDYIRAVYASWDGDNIPEDSVIYLNNNADVSFKHMYDTTESGMQAIRFWVDDFDSIKSLDTVITVDVKEGRPLLWADTVDTIWIIIDNGTGEYYPLHINCRDTKGTFERFYWHEAATFDTTSGSCYKTADSTRMRSFSGAELHTGLPIHIYGIDNDGYMNGGQFVIYADSVPPEPLVSSDPIDGGREIYWSRKDTKDGDNTEYQILCDKNNPPTTIVSDYKAGSNYEDGGAFDYKFLFTPEDGIGVYYCLIKARDARKSVTEANGVHSFNYTE